MACVKSDLLVGHANRKCKTYLTEAVEWKSVLLLKRFSVPQQVCQETSASGLQTHEIVWIAEDPQPRGSLNTNVSTSEALSYRLAKHLARQLVCHTGNSLHHIKNSTDYVRTLDSFHTGP
jgi:hypothetical protein